MAVSCGKVAHRSTSRVDMCPTSGFCYSCLGTDAERTAVEHPEDELQQVLARHLPPQESAGSGGEPASKESLQTGSSFYGAEKGEVPAANK